MTTLNNKRMTTLNNKGMTTLNNVNIVKDAMAAELPSKGQSHIIILRALFTKITVVDVFVDRKVYNNLYSQKVILHLQSMY